MALSVAKAILFCIYASLHLCSSKRIINLPMNDSVSAVLAFGDSFVDQGNNNNISAMAKANFPPYGQDFMGGLPTGRFSNGKTIADFLAEAFRVKEYLPAYLDPSLEAKDFRTGVSFASGGTGFDSLTTSITYAIPPASQLQYFKQYIGRLNRNFGEKATINIITKSVFVVVASTNDLVISLPMRRFQYDVPGYANILVNLEINFLKELYKLGARRIVVFGAPPIGCFPAVRTIAGGLLRMCQNNYNVAAQVFNRMLKHRLENLESSLPQSKVAFVDFYNPLISVIQYPQRYGLEVIDRGCCGIGEIEASFLCNRHSSTCNNDSQFLFWDSIHLSEIGAKIFINTIEQDLVNNLF